MLTKKYKNGFVTLNAEMFLPITQETIDREIQLRAGENGNREVARV